MASGSGNGSGRGYGRDGPVDPRCSISMKGKGTMINNLDHNNPTYHEYLQRRTYAEDLGLNLPNPPIIISEHDPNDTTPNLTSQSENMPDIDTPPDFGFDTPEVDLEREEDLIQKQSKSDLFVKHMKKIRNEDGSIIVACNYCNKVYKWSRSGGYGTYWKHIEAKHPEAVIKMRSQTQIPRCSSSSSDSHAELESYLASSCEFPEEFDLLKYWNDATKYYPIMAMIAKNIFSTPISTVAVEQEFSAGGNILDEKRSCLTPKALQIQVCVDDWTKAEYRQQEIQQEPTYDFFKDDEPKAGKGSGAS
ncbi:hypothetical protein LWI29_014006 [Acer saccharum]|uniref:HAT C-terminal dimerisation domain-containing protein n=1 Tax=Acer saccharum TaxID=4024 RepID=A0AA39TFE7_ACESA|nr:hypothetical protein LWI29_014006 [Acer saccharum]